MVIRNRKDQNGRSLYAGQLDFNPAGNPRSTGHAFADALLGQLPHATPSSQSDPIGLLPLLAGRRLRLRQLAAVAQPEHRGRPALHLAPADLHPGEQHGELRSRPLRPGAGGDGEPQRHARARLRRPLQRHRPRGRGRARGRAVPRAQRQQPRACSPCPPARRAASTTTSTCSAAVQLRLDAARAEPRWPSAAAIGLFYDRPEGNLLFGGGGNGRSTARPTSLARSTRTATSPLPAAARVPALAPHGRDRRHRPRPEGSRAAGTGA